MNSQVFEHGGNMKVLLQTVPCGVLCLMDVLVCGDAPLLAETLVTCAGEWNKILPFGATVNKYERNADTSVKEVGKNQRNTVIS